MENRRNTNTNLDKPFNRDRRDSFQKKPDDRYSGERKFQPRDDKFQSRDDKFQPKSDRFQPRTNDERSQPREGGRVPPRQGLNNPPRDNKFQPRDNRFPPRDNRFQPRDNRFQNKPPGKFDPTKKRFPPRGAKPVEGWKKDDNSHIKITSEMQVTDGKHRGKFFQSTTSPKVRPTTRKIREALFRVILRRVRGGRFLDLCAGSGAVGIEAISRGALLSTFVERSAKMCSFVKKNMATMEIKEGHGEVHEIEVIPFLKQMAKRRRQWDVVFLDPPYDTNYDEILEFFKRGVCIKVGGALVIEHHAEMFFHEKLGVLKRWRVIVEGESAISFYERK